MFEVHGTAAFSSWIRGLRDREARNRILERIRRLRFGNFGDAKPVGDGVIELRIDYGPGYRVYMTRRGPQVMVLLCGGDKRTQDRDIAAAKVIARDLKE